MQIIDLHCDTITRFTQGEHLRGMENGHVSLEKLKAGETMAQCFAIFVFSNDELALPGVPPTSEEFFYVALRRYREELELCKDTLLPATTAAEIEANRAAGKISSILTVEDGVTLNGHLENVDMYYREGVRMVSLTWNYENSLGYPHSTDPEKHALGLKPFGVEAVRRMNELGIAVDVSHLSEGGFWDVVKTSAKPFIASHSCARALCDHSRNLTDEQLRAMGDKGSVVGLNYLTEFLKKPIGRPDDDHTDVDLAIRHLRHMVNVAGIESVGLGSDYDGMENTLEWGDCGGQQLLAQGIEKAFGYEAAEKICYKNVLRVFRDIIGK